MGRIAREIRYCDTERFKYRGERRLSKDRHSHRPKTTSKVRAPTPSPTMSMATCPKLPNHLAVAHGHGYGRIDRSSEEGLQNPGLGIGHEKERLYPHLFKTESERQAGVLVKDFTHKRAGSSYQVDSDRYNLRSLELKQTGDKDVTSHDVTKAPEDAQNSYNRTDKQEHPFDTLRVNNHEGENALETLAKQQSDKDVSCRDGTSGVLVRMYDRYSDEQDQHDVTGDAVSDNAANVELHAECESSTDSSEESFLYDLVKGIVKDALDGALISLSVEAGYRNCYIDSISTKICTDAMAKVRKYIYRNDSNTEGWEKIESTAATLVLNAMKHALDLKDRCEYIVYNKKTGDEDEGSYEKITEKSQSECFGTTHSERKENDVSGSVDDLVGMAVYMLLI